MAAPLPRDPIADAQRNWEEHGWADVAAPMAAIPAIMRTQPILVARSPHPTDGRTTLIELTAEGRIVAKRATAVLNTEVFGQSGFDAADVDQLIGILGTFRRNAGDFTD